MHAKNVSVRAVEARVEVTPCYDLLSTLPYGDRSLALAMEGRDDNLTRAHLLTFGERIGLRRAAVEAVITGFPNTWQRRFPAWARSGSRPRA